MPEGNPSCFVAAVGYCHPLDKKKSPAPEVPSGSFAVPDPSFPLGVSLHVDVKTTKQGQTTSCSSDLSTSAES
jgi:hypothetical protein